MIGWITTKRHYKAPALGILMAVSGLAAATFAGGEGQKRVPVIVVLQEGVEPDSAAADAVRQHGARVSAVYRHALRGFAAVVAEGRVQALRHDPRVAFVEPDLPVSIVAQELPPGVNRVDADQNAIANIDGIDERVDVDIAIIDTGIDLDHPDLNVFTDRGFFGGAKSGDDDHGHGTHVAGIAAALDNEIGVVGVAPGARLWALKVLDSNGAGRFSSIVKAVDFVTENADQIEVVNMSLGGLGRVRSLRTAIQNSVAAGVVYVAAAGNYSIDVYGQDGVFDTGDDG